MNSNKNLDLARKAFPYNEDQRVAYMLGLEEGYDQAMQDFLEKACERLEPTFKSIAGYNCGGDLMNDFKNYMQDEM